MIILHDTISLSKLWFLLRWGVGMHEFFIVPGKNIKFFPSHWLKSPFPVGIAYFEQQGLVSEKFLEHFQNGRISVPNVDGFGAGAIYFKYFEIRAFHK